MGFLGALGFFIVACLIGVPVILIMAGAIAFWGYIAILLLPIALAIEIAWGFVLLNLLDRIS